MICAKRIDTGSPWVLTNNPASKYWDSADKSHKPNKEYELWMLVRASAAAPLYFEPVEVTITEKGEVYEEQKGLFIDGAVGGFNNPSLQALKVATLPSYGFNWQTGARQPVRRLGRHRLVARAPRRRATSIEAVELAEGDRSAVRDDPGHGAAQHHRDAGDLVAAQAVVHQQRDRPYARRRVVQEDVLSYQRYDALLEPDDICRVCNIADPASGEAKSLVDALRQLGNTDAAQPQEPAHDRLRGRPRDQARHRRHRAGGFPRRVRSAVHAVAGLRL